MILTFFEQYFVLSPYSVVAYFFRIYLSVGYLADCLQRNRLNGIGLTLVRFVRG